MLKIYLKLQLNKFTNVKKIKRVKYLSSNDEL